MSKVKVFFNALLGYIALNGIRNILFAVAGIIFSGIGIKFIRYRLEDIAFFMAFYVGFAVVHKIGEKLLKTDDELRRYEKTIGLLLIINNTYLIIDYFRYDEGSLFFLSMSLIIGICLFFANRKKEETEEKILTSDEMNEY